MKKPRKIPKNFRLQPKLVSGLENLSERLDCSKTKILESALEQMIQEFLFEDTKT